MLAWLATYNKAGQYRFTNHMKRDNKLRRQVLVSLGTLFAIPNPPSPFQTDLITLESHGALYTPPSATHQAISTLSHLVKFIKA
jgi:hypothetical protein